MGSGSLALTGVLTEASVIWITILVRKLLSSKKALFEFHILKSRKLLAAAGTIPGFWCVPNTP
jgi:hypothetical protein